MALYAVLRSVDDDKSYQILAVTKNREDAEYFADNLRDGDIIKIAKVKTFERGVTERLWRYEVKNDAAYLVGDENGSQYPRVITERIADDVISVCGAFVYAKDKEDAKIKAWQTIKIFETRCQGKFTVV